MNFLFKKKKKKIFETKQVPRNFPIFCSNNNAQHKQAPQINKKNETNYLESVEAIKCYNVIHIILIEVFNMLFETDFINTIDSLKSNHKIITSRQRINKRKKKTSVHKDALRKIKSNDKNGIVNEFIRCAHKGNEQCTKDNCECFSRGFCEKYCICNKNVCQLFKKGCTCKSNCKKKSCPCLAREAECDEDQCRGCFHNNCLAMCQNRNNFETSNTKKTAIAKSERAGWGLFAMEGVKKGDYICEYIGEVLNRIILS
jgi:hypothetical protein